ncbi:FecR domain-containing protein [Leptospira sp. WS92.C1]
MKSRWIAAIVICISILFLNCRKEQSDRTKGVITFVNGDVFIQRGDQKIKASVSQEILNGDLLTTGPKSVATIVFGENSSIIEIQSDSRFRLQQESNERIFFQERGSSWVLANKLLKDEKMTLHTPTTTAGVRGTKFYTAVHGDMTFTCHCEGQIELENTANHSKKVNNSDYLAVVKGDKTVYIIPSDLQKENIGYSHNHSEIQNSPVGNQNKMTPEQLQIMFKIVQKKLTAP